MKILPVAMAFLLGALISTTSAQELGDASEVARKSSNPLGGDFMVLINEWSFNSYNGAISDKDRTGIIHIFQPVIPISMEETIGEHWILVNRPTIPLVYNTPVPTGPNPINPPFFNYDYLQGVADISHFSLLGISKPSSNSLLGDGDLVVAGGFSINIPTGSSDLTTRAWAAGPAGVAAYIGKKGILGALVQTQFDFASTGSAPVDYDRMFVQPFYYINLADGWQIGGAPLMTFDFNSHVHDVSLGLGVQKTQLFKLGEDAMMPIRFGAEVRYNVAYDSADPFGKEWSFHFSVSPIIPNIVQNLIRGCPAMSVGGC